MILRLFTYAVLISLMNTSVIHNQALAEVSVSKRPLIRVDGDRQFKALRQELSNMPKGAQKEWKRWQLARWATIHDHVKWAKRQFKKILNDKTSPVPKDEVHLNLARLYYQTNKMRNALKHYNSISARSDHWFEATEEAAWAYLRKSEEHKSLAKIKTLMASVFKYNIGPEPYYLEALANFRICDYPGVFKVTDRFKRDYRKRIQALQKLVKTGESKALDKLMSRASDAKLNVKTVGSLSATLPQLFYRDYYFKRHFRKGRTNKAVERMQFLAKRDLGEISKVIQRLNIVEAEVIQRIHESKKARGDRNKLSLGKNDLVFPSVGEEVWIDELDSFQVSTRRCARKKGS